MPVSRSIFRRGNFPVARGWIKSCSPMHASKTCKFTHPSIAANNWRSRLRLHKEVTSVGTLQNRVTYKQWTTSLESLALNVVAVIAMLSCIQSGHSKDMTGQHAMISCIWTTAVRNAKLKKTLFCVHNWKVQCCRIVRFFGARAWIAL